MKIDVNRIKSLVEFIESELEKETDPAMKKWHTGVKYAYESILNGKFEIEEVSP